MEVKFISLASGSSGNCYFIGTERGAILIDAGISARGIKRTLKAAGIGMEHILGVFVTHDHSDHIKGVGTLGEKLHIPVYCTRRTHEGINRCRIVSDKLYNSVRHIEKGVVTAVGDFRVEPFEVPHDAADSVGFCVEVDGRVFAFLTDLGEITPLAASYIARAHYLIIEANYDVEMLRHGTYPGYLKQRIASGTGHLSNAATAEFLATHLPPALRRIWLCHLSRDNNRPELAFSTVADRLRDAGVVVGSDLLLEALERTSPSFYLL